MNKPGLYLIMLFLLVSYVFAAQNPAIQFCIKNGNSIEERIDNQGNEFSVCVLKNNTAIEAWDNYRENAGKKITIGKNMPVFTTMQAKSIQKNKVYLSSQSGQVSAAASANSFAASGLVSTPVPSSFDWRNYNSQNFVTPVKDQGACGSCWAFTTAAAVESRAKINLNFPRYNIDLSEQDLVSCSGAGSCDGGVVMDALDYIKNSGIVKESSFPYTATDNVCSNKLSTSGLTKAGYALLPNNADAIKQAISTTGPVTVYLGVCDDFAFYNGATYNHSRTMLDDESCWTYVEGEGYYLNGHTMELVGYNDIEGFWIAKNSWGDEWGAGGYIAIAYSENVENSTLWFEELNANPESTESRILFLDDSYKITTTDANNDGKADTEFLRNLSTRVTNDSFYFNFSTSHKTNYTLTVSNSTGSVKFVKTNSTTSYNKSSVLTGLKSNTSYKYNLTVCDSSRNCFFTNGTLKTLQNQPQASNATNLSINNFKTVLSNSSFTFNFTTNKPTNYTMTLMTSGINKTIKLNQSFLSSRYVVFSGLKSNTTYLYNLTVCDSSKFCIFKTGSNKTSANARQNNLNILKINATKSAMTFNFTTTYSSNYTLTLFDGINGMNKTVKSDTNFSSKRIINIYSLKSNTTYNYSIVACDTTKLCAKNSGQKKTL